MITRRTKWLGVVMSLALLTSCADEFLTGASITRMRLLGAQVIIDGAPGRAWLRAGDNGRAAFSLAFPNPAKDDPARANPVSSVRSMFLSCTEGDIGTGQPQCAEVLFLFEAYRRFQAGEFDVDASLPDGGAPPQSPISAEDIEATFAALERGVGCDDRGDVGDPNDPDDDVPDYFGNAASGIRQVTLTSQAASLTCVNRAPGVPLTLAADYAGPDRLIQGVICEYGEPVFQLDPPFFACRYEVGSDPNLPNRAPIAEVFFVTVGVERDGVSNDHPRFAVNDPIALSNFAATAPKPTPRAWTDEAVPADCSAVTDPTRIRDYGRKSLITLGVAANREEISAVPLRLEPHQVEAYSTFGEIDRQFSVVDDLDPLVADGTDGDKVVVEFEWNHGKLPLPAKNTLVRFNFLIRDGRGGFAEETRWLCLCRGGTSCQ